MWEFENLSGISAQSYVRGDTYGPKICPLEFYDIVRHADPTASVFHIVLYSDHCEVWHKAHWERSLSKRHAVLTASDARDKARLAERVARTGNENLRKQVYNELILLLPTVPVETLWTFAGAMLTVTPAFFETNNFPSIKALIFPVINIPSGEVASNTEPTVPADDSDTDEPIYQ